MTGVADNVQRIRDRVAAAALGCGRRPEAVRIIAVGKTKPAEMIRAVHAAGLSDIGENYVQEAAAKRGVIDLPFTWHMIGHLQRNKAKRAVELFDVVQSVDSLALAQALNRHAAELGKHLAILLEVNLGGETSKSGMNGDEVQALLEPLAQLQHLSLRGLMTIPPADPQAARRAFRQLRELRERLSAGAPANLSLHELSMGMSDDFEIAIAEGATMVRIGTAIFGERVAP